MTDRLPTLAEVSCVPLRFQPGDKILIKVWMDLTAEQQSKLKNAVEKWSGVEALIVDARFLDFEVCKPQTCR